MSYLRHNDMAPFLGSKSHANNSPNATECQLDHKNGPGFKYISEKRQSPMFSSGNNSNGTHGMSSTTDVI